jgi:alpha-amylase/alpha-mannosidase (GH57 family)
MKRTSTCHLCIHGHFYQPPREDPFTGRISREPSAAPYANWNERITAECYEPNAKAGNFERISFNLGGTLARWLDEEAHQTYERIVEADRTYRGAHGMGNGLAQSVHHTILPLARRRDKICQVRWGIASFEHRLGHRPEGMWLPEMAVDHETLEVLAAEGIRFTILSDEQVYGSLKAGGGPYRVALPNGSEIAIFVRDRHLSNHLSFGMPDSAYVDDWLKEHVAWRCQRNGLHIVATDGETFGHHHRQGTQVLSHILGAGERHGYHLTTLGLYLHQHPPEAEIRVIENTAWSCAHGLDRWVVGCGCTLGDNRWKGALRRALDNLACDLDQIYAREANQLGFEPWPLRDRYIDVVLGKVSEEAFLNGNGLGHLTSEETQRLLHLLEAQLHRQRMYISCTFFFGDLDRYEPRYAIANAVRALALTRYATGEDLSHGFRRDLSVAMSEETDVTGADIFDGIVSRAELEARPGPPVCGRPQP